MTPEQAVAKLDALAASANEQDNDPEDSHWDADEILLKVVPPEVRAAYERVIERCGAWWYA